MRMNLEIGQERMAFLTGHITEKQMRTKKGSRKVKILHLQRRKGIATVEMVATGMKAMISFEGIIPFKHELEN